MGQTRLARFSRYTLGGIRLVSGAAALGAPRVVSRRLGVDGDPSVLYVWRATNTALALLARDR
jgi:hypothetical protein